MSNELIKFGTAKIRHSTASDRVYVMSIGSESPEGVLVKAENLAAKQGYGKIFAKIPGAKAQVFHQAGFITEASIPNFFKDGSELHFMGHFLKKERKEDPHQKKVEAILKKCRETIPKPASKRKPSGVTFRRAQPNDAEILAQIYRKVFISYPFPIHDPEYIRKTMLDNVIYMLALNNKSLIAACSAECYPEEMYAEMTDFATLPESRGSGLATLLLAHTEEVVASNHQMRVWMTIARSLSAGMNLVFRHHGYDYGGTLINNTGIAGAIESMNVWHKHP